MGATCRVGACSMPRPKPRQTTTLVNNHRQAPSCWQVRVHLVECKVFVSPLSGGHVTGCTITTPRHTRAHDDVGTPSGSAWRRSGRIVTHPPPASRSIPPPWRSIRFRLALRTYAPWGVRVVSQTKSRKIPGRNILPLFLVIPPASPCTCDTASTHIYDTCTDTHTKTRAHAHTAPFACPPKTVHVRRGVVPACRCTGPRIRHRRRRGQASKGGGGRERGVG